MVLWKCFKCDQVPRLGWNALSAMCKEEGFKYRLSMETRMSDNHVEKKRADIILFWWIASGRVRYSRSS